VSVIYYRRPGLLLIAVISVTVPGVIAAYAAISQGTARRAVPDAPSGYAVNVAAAAHSQGMRLLAQAAAAGLATSYQGVELISRWNVDGTSTVMSTVWHRAGGLTLTQTADTTAGTQAQPQLSYDSDGQDPEGVFGVTKTMVALLGTHYAAQYAGPGSMAGRSALIVQVRRPDGSLAATFWLDKQTKLPLGREDYDPNAQIISQDIFIDVTFGNPAIPPEFSTLLGTDTGTGGSSVPPGVAAAYAKIEQMQEPGQPRTLLSEPPVPSGVSVTPVTPWIEASVPVQLVHVLRGQGWQVPPQLPGGLSLYAAAQTSTTAGRVVDLGYSDGLFAVSLFVQRGDLASRLAGFESIKVGGREVFAAGHDIVWSGHGFVYTMLADAPSQTVDQVVAVLPHDSPPGFWRRLGRGFGRLASWVNPFR
jgi:hypothetical protein